MPRDFPAQGRPRTLRPRPRRASFRPENASAGAVEMLETRLLLSTSVYSYHNDSASTGQNLTETVFTPSNVPASFARLYSQPLDGQVYAQPLYVPGLSVTTGGQTSV